MTLTQRENGVKWKKDLKKTEAKNWVLQLFQVKRDQTAGRKGGATTTKKKFREKLYVGKRGTEEQSKLGLANCQQIRTALE